MVKSVDNCFIYDIIYNSKKLIINKEMTYMKVNFTETVLRDANQSLIATRLPFEKFAPVLSEMDKAV